MAAGAAPDRKRSRGQRVLEIGRWTRTNDPREFAPIWPGIVGYPGDEPLTRRGPFELIEKAEKLLHDSVHVVCLTEDEPSRLNPARYGTGPRRARMWAQYSENHTGICVCFDGQRLIDAAYDQLKPTPPDRSLIHGKVKYAQEGENPYMQP